MLPNFREILGLYNKTNRDYNSFMAGKRRTQLALEGPRNKVRIILQELAKLSGEDVRDVHLTETGLLKAVGLCASPQELKRTASVMREVGLKATHRAGITKIEKEQ
jgi:hypothetical protein